MTAVISDKRGRPKTRLVDRLRVALWSHSVLLACGLNEVQELEDKFAKSPGLKMANGLWSRYMRGEVLPQGALQPGVRNNLVHRVAQVLPKTADVFYAPFWEYLEWAPLVNFDLVRATYLRLGEDISRQFVK